MPVEYLGPVSRAFAIVVGICGVALAGMLLLTKRRLLVRLRFFVFFALGGALLNFWNCATFSQLNGRYGFWMMWLVPFYAQCCAPWPCGKQKKVELKSLVRATIRYRYTWCVWRLFIPA